MSTVPPDTPADDRRCSPQRHVSSTLLYRACMAGYEPAESLPEGDRAWLVTVLHKRGWTDTEIAQHCRMTTYTTARIRQRLQLSPNTMRKGAA